MRRSRLYLPGNEPKFLINAGLKEGYFTLGADDDTFADIDIENFIDG